MPGQANAQTGLEGSLAQKIKRLIDLHLRLQETKKKTKRKKVLLAGCRRSLRK